MTVPFSYVSGNLTLILDGKSASVGSDHPNFKAIRNGLRDKSADELCVLVDLNVVAEKAAIWAQDLTSGHVTINNGTIYYDDKAVDESLTAEVAQLQGAGMPVVGMFKFIGRLYNNMSYRARHELLAFMQRNGLTIDSEGFLIAYKAVTADYMDKWHGTIKYAVGSEISMDRGEVDDNDSKACSKGLHAGALSYVYWYGNGDDRIIIVRIDPADVVCVPKASDCRKLRCCRLVVIGDYDGEFKHTVYDVDKSVEERYEDEYEEDDKDEFDWRGVEDDDSDDEAIDDYITSDQVTVRENAISIDSECCGGHDGQYDESLGEDNTYGVKPVGSSQAGRKYYNRRGGKDNPGRFA